MFSYEQFDKSDFNAFMRVVATQAIQLQQNRELPITNHKCEILFENEIRHTVAASQGSFQVIQINYQSQSEGHTIHTYRQTRNEEEDPRSINTALFKQNL